MIKRKHKFICPNPDCPSQKKHGLSTCTSTEDEKEGFTLLTETCIKCGTEKQWKGRTIIRNNHERYDWEQK